MLAFGLLAVLLALAPLLARVLLGPRGDLLGGPHTKGGKNRHGNGADPRANDSPPGRSPSQGEDQIVEAFALHGTPRKLMCPRSSATIGRVVGDDVSTSGA